MDTRARFALLPAAALCPDTSPQPPDGQAATTCSTVHDATCAPTCDPGFALSGTYTCDTASGSWTGSPSCSGTHSGSSSLRRSLTAICPPSLPASIHPSIHLSIHPSCRGHMHNVRCCPQLHHVLPHRHNQLMAKLRPRAPPATAQRVLLHVTLALP